MPMVVFGGLGSPYIDLAMDNEWKMNGVNERTDGGASQQQTTMQLSRRGEKKGFSNHVIKKKGKESLVT